VLRSVHLIYHFTDCAVAVRRS